MSVDDRLRGLFTAETPDASVGPTLARVHERVDRDRARNRVLGGGLVAGVLVAGVAVGVSLGGPEAAPSPAPPAPTAEVTTPVDGVWEAGPVGEQDIRATLRSAGQRRWIPTVLADLPQPPIRYRMTVAEGLVTLELAGDDGEFRRFDEGGISVSRDELGLEPTGVRGVNRYRWELVDGALRLTLLSSSEASSEETPNEAFQRALYSAADWTREP